MNTVRTIRPTTQLFPRALHSQCESTPQPCRLICPLYLKGVCWSCVCRFFRVLFSSSLNFFLCTAFSLILSCVVIGISISLLFAPIPKDSENDEKSPYDGGTFLEWKRWHDSSFRTRDIGPYIDHDGIGYRTAPILALVATASNFLIITPL